MCIHAADTGAMLCDTEACKHTVAAIMMHLSFDAKQQTLHLNCVKAKLQVFCNTTQLSLLVLMLTTL
jgi:hypothetical protein